MRAVSVLVVMPAPSALTDRPPACFNTEVVLAMLVENFTFEVPQDLKAPIVWSVAGIQYPSVGYESEKGELPLRVGRV